MTPPKKSVLFPIVLIATLALALILYGEKWLRAILLHLSDAAWARQVVTRFPPAWYVASRFVAGETMADAIRATEELNGAGMKATMDYLGESVTDPQEAVAARDAIVAMLQEINTSGVRASVSVKLSQLGLKIDNSLALDNMRHILTVARSLDNFVRIDMEESALVDATLELFYTLRDGGYENVGIVIQAYLYRSEADVRRLIEDGATVRLCKGAYMEPPSVAFPEKHDTDANFIRLTQLLLSEEARSRGVYPAIATHDEEMIEATLAYARNHEVTSDAFEFQMLFGIRRELQQALVEQGYRMRVYVPYGTAWYPYLMRRLAERPANLWFFLTNLLRG